MEKYKFLEVEFKKSDPLEPALYIIATPIGNLEDITFRALRILSEVDKIACEDTRVTLKLLNFFHIKKPLISYYEHNEERVAPIILDEILNQKKSLALVTDAGTPCISDPGAFLISKLVENNIPIISIPGPSSFVSLLSISGFYLNDFFFIGFLPIKKSKRIKKLSTYFAYKTVLIIYESPYRIIKLIDEIHSIFPPNTLLVIGRELTKKFEQIYRGDIQNLFLNKTDFSQKGEYTILINNKN